MPEHPLFVVADDGGCQAAGALAPGLRATLVAIGPGAAEVAGATPAALDRVVAVPALDWSLPVDALGPAVQLALGGAGSAGATLVLASSQPARDLAGWLVGTAGAAVLWAVDAIGVGPDGDLRFDRVVLGGSHRLEHVRGRDGLTVVLVKAPAPAPARRPDEPGPAVEVRADIVAAPSRVRLVARRAEPAGGIALASARVVVSVGRGIGGPEPVELFTKLADRLGGALGATRAVVDAGWLPFAHQVGQTGASVGPEVYLAFGVSGAIQHLAGMRGSRTVVAVNTDPEAPLCQLADLVVTGDAVAVADALLERLLARPERSGGS